jgi:hypothetical protein
MVSHAIAYTLKYGLDSEPEGLSHVILSAKRVRLRFAVRTGQSHTTCYWFESRRALTDVRIYEPLELVRVVVAFVARDHYCAPVTVPRNTSTQRNNYQKLALHKKPAQVLSRLNDCGQRAICDRLTYAQRIDLGLAHDAICCKRAIVASSIAHGQPRGPTN